VPFLIVGLPFILCGLFLMLYGEHVLELYKEKKEQLAEVRRQRRMRIKK
jgi:hypothetical protein